jgi:hypothetical protein
VTADARGYATRVAQTTVLYVVWVAATYLLEGLPRTLLRPQAHALRAAYTITANLIVGTLGSMFVLHRLVGSRSITAPSAGFGSRRRSVIGIALGLSLGAAVHVAQAPSSVGVVVLLNLFAQVLPVSVAEVLVCWSLVGVAAGSTRAGRATRAVIVAVIASVAFGLYHIAHSPPFNALGMIGLLIVVGLATSTFFIVVRDVYGTIVFHNFFALFGVRRALEASGRMADFETIDMPLLITALTSFALLRAAHTASVRSRPTPVS